MKPLWRQIKPDHGASPAPCRTAHQSQHAIFDWHCCIRVGLYDNPRRTQGSLSYVTRTDRNRKKLFKLARRLRQTSRKADQSLRLLSYVRRLRQIKCVSVTTVKVLSSYTLHCFLRLHCI
jgi:hypothetical protein